MVAIYGCFRRQSCNEVGCSTELGRMAFPVRVSRGTEGSGGVEQKTCLSGASLFCVRQILSTGVCPRSGSNGVGARGSPEGCRAAPLWARPARTSTVIGAMTSQFGSKSSGYDAVATGVRASRGAPTQEHKSEGLPAYNGLTNTFEFRCQLYSDCRAPGSASTPAASNPCC